MHEEQKRLDQMNSESGQRNTYSGIYIDNSRQNPFWEGPGITIASWRGTSQTAQMTTYTRSCWFQGRRFLRSLQRGQFFIGRTML